MRDVGLLRLAAQRLAGPPCDTAAEVVRWLTALQAQDLRGALTAVALRTRDRSVEAVVAALASGSVVRTWPMRGTLHLVPAEDLGWLVSLLGPRGEAKAAPRRPQLGLDQRALERSAELAAAALADGRQLAREDLFAAWEAGGLTTSGGRGYHLLVHLAQTGRVCLGPLEGTAQRVVLTDGWIRGPRVLEREQALGELAWRYFASHGPATARDFTRWTGLLAADVRTGVALARPRLEAIAIDGVEHLMDPATPDRLADCSDPGRLLLLPGFDEYLLGYGDRGAVLPAAFADRIVPGGNGVFRPTVVDGGQVVGTWRHAGRGAGRTVEAEPFTAFGRRQERAIARAHAALP